MNKVNTYLGFARKSGNLVMGGETCMIHMDRKKIKFLLIAEDASEGSRKKLSEKAERQGIPYRISGLADEMSHAAGSPGRTVFGITDSHFARILMEAADACSADTDMEK